MICRLRPASLPPLPALRSYTFEGFRNADGSVGTKNILGITTTVQCVAPTVDYAVRRIKAEILPRYPAVDDVVAITHTYGCGVAIDAPGAAVPIRTLRNISLHANFGGAPLVVSLGCEKLQPARLFPDQVLRRVAADPLPVLNGEARVLRLQDEPRGFGEIIAAIMRAAEKRLEELSRRRRAKLPGIRVDRRPAMRRQRRVLRRHLQSGGRLRGRPAGSRRRHGHVLRSDRSARRGPPADAARHQ